MPTFDGLVTHKVPPEKRAVKALGEHEEHLYEGAVMLAFAMDILGRGLSQEVMICPDGEHAKQFDQRGWLERRGFVQVDRIGTTSYGGTYADQSGMRITINPKSGQGDVSAMVGDVQLSAECKGGIINTRHPGQLSRLRRGLCEAVGLLMSYPNHGRQVAVVPYTEATTQLAARLTKRCGEAGVEIALVKPHGQVVFV